MVRELSPAKREKFLSAALKLFVAHGVQNTSTADIAREAGTAAGTLFLYFPRKLDLIQELVLKISKEQSEYIQALLVPPLPAREMFFKIWWGSIRWFLDHLVAYQYVQQIRESGLVEAAVAEETGKHLTYYFVAIQQGLKEDAIKPYPPEMIGEFLYFEIVALMNIIKAQPDSSQQEMLIQRGFDIFWDGIRIRDSQQQE